MSDDNGDKDIEATLGGVAIRMALLQVQLDHKRSEADSYRRLARRLARELDSVEKGCGNLASIRPVLEQARAVGLLPGAEADKTSTGVAPEIDLLFMDRSRV